MRRKKGMSINLFRDIKAEDDIETTALNISSTSFQVLI